MLQRIFYTAYINLTLALVQLQRQSAFSFILHIPMYTYNIFLLKRDTLDDCRKYIDSLDAHSNVWIIFFKAKCKRLSSFWV